MSETPPRRRHPSTTHGAKERSQIRDEEIWLLRQRGWTCERIGRHVGLAQSGVSKSLQRTSKLLAERFVSRAEEIKIQQTAILEKIAEVALEQFSRSTHLAEETERITGRAAYDSRNQEVVDLPDLHKTVRRGQTGNPAHLAQAIKAYESIRAIWGLNAPEQLKVETEDTGIAQQLDTKLSDLAERFALLQRGTSGNDAEGDAGDVPREPEQ
jgi:predicted transcriptional regulator